MDAYEFNSFPKNSGSSSPQNTKQVKQNGSPPSSPNSNSNSNSVSIGSENTDEVLVRILVPSSMVGSLIGKGGATIKEMIKQSGSKIHIGQSDDGSSEKIVVMNGSISCVSTAELLMSTRMQEETFAEFKDLDSSISLNDRISLSPLKLLVSNIIIGRLIGKNGVNLRKIMTDSNTYIACSREDDFSRSTGDRLVIVIGNIANQNKAFGIILQQTKEFLQNSPQYREEIRPRSPHYEPYVHNQQSLQSSQSYGYSPRQVSYPMLSVQRANNRMPYRSDLQDAGVLQKEETLAVYVPNGIVGTLIGKGGTTVRDFSRAASCSINIPRDSEVDVNAADRPITLTGPLASIFKAESLIYAKIFEASPTLGGGPDYTLKVELKIPNELVGRVIGKKGIQIKQISEKSGARIVIEKDENLNDRTILKINGKLDSNLLAQQLIQEVLFQHTNGDS